MVEYNANRLSTAERSIARLQQSLDAPKEPKARLRQEDFVQHLPEFTSPDPVLREVQRSSQGHGVTFLAAQVTNQPASDSRLGRSELTVELRGLYPGLKAVLADVLARYPNVVLKHLTIRRSSSGELDARLELTMLSRPTGMGR